LVPYGERWALLLPEILAAASIFVIGMAARKLLGSIGGVLAVLTAATTTIILRYGNELRSYSLLLFLTSLLLFIIISREQTNVVNKLHVAALGVCLAAMVYAFALSVFVCVVIFAADVIRIIRRKLKAVYILSYAVALILYFPYFILFFTSQNHVQPGSGYVMPIADIFLFIVALLDSNFLYVYMFVYGAGLAFFTMLMNKRLKSEMRAQNNMIVLFAAMAIIPIAMFYLTNRIFILFFGRGFDVMTRYLIYTIPTMVIVAVSSFCRICESVKVFVSHQKYWRIAALSLILALSLYSIPKAYTSLMNYPKQYYEDKKYVEAADWLYNREDIFAGSTAVCFLVQEYVPDTLVYKAARGGWFEYYATQKGQRRKFEFIEMIDESVKNFDVIYTLENQREINSDELLLLSDDYELVEASEEICIKVWNRK
jgi:hypothetical protein